MITPSNCRIVIIMGALLFSAPASADILFLNLQGSVKEYKEVVRAAKKRGEKVIEVPAFSDEDRNTISKIIAKDKAKRNEHEHATLERLAVKYKLADTAAGPQSGDKPNDLTKLSLKTTSLLPQVLIETLKNTPHGDLRSLVISGHSTGKAYLSELYSGKTTIEQLTAALAQAGVEKSIQSVLLLGCYGHTPLAVKKWHKGLPDLKVVGGFSRKAPLAKDPESAAMVRWFFDRIADAENIKVVEAAEKKLPQALKQRMAGASLVCASPGEAELERQCPGILQALKDSTDFKNFMCVYQVSENACYKVPKDQPGTSLRGFYGNLQDAEVCLDGRQDCSRDGFPTIEATIALIKFEHVIENFMVRFKDSIQDVSSNYPQLSKTLRSGDRAKIRSLIGEMKKECGPIPGKFFELKNQACFNFTGFMDLLMDLKCIPIAWIESPTPGREVDLPACETSRCEK